MSFIERHERCAYIREEDGLIFFQQGNVLSNGNFSCRQFVKLFIDQCKGCFRMNVGKDQFLQFLFRIAQHVTKFFIGGKKGFLTDIGYKNPVGSRIENGSES